MNNDNQAPSFPEAIRNAIDSRLVDVHTMLPGKVKSYFPDKGTIDVTLTVKTRRRKSDGEMEAIELPTLYNVPLAFPRCALAWDTWPVGEGDAVLVHFAERELGEWTQSQYGQIIDPGDAPTHTLNGPVAYLGGHPATHPITPTPNIRDRVIHAGNELHLGTQDPQYAVARAEAMLDLFDSFITVITGSAWVPVPNDGGAALKVAVTTWAGAAKPIYENLVASTKVKVV